MLFLPVGKNSLTKMLIRFRGAPTYKTHVNKTEKEKGLAGTLHIKLDAYLPNAIPTDNLIFFSKKILQLYHLFTSSSKLYILYRKNIDK